MSYIVPQQSYAWVDLTASQQLRVAADLGDQGRVFAYADRTQSVLLSNKLVRPSETVLVPTGGAACSALVTCSHGSLEYEVLDSAGYPDSGLQSDLVFITESRLLNNSDNGKTLVFKGPWTVELTPDLELGFSCAAMPPVSGIVRVSAPLGVTVNTVAGPTQVSRSGALALFAIVAIEARTYIITGS